MLLKTYMTDDASFEKDFYDFVNMLTKHNLIEGGEKEKINVAVTGLNAIDSPGPGVPVIRALRDSKLFDVKIIGLSYESLEPGIYMHDIVDKTYQIPLPSRRKSDVTGTIEIH